jgi:alkanesulfonate monooxygenase SsuD/methylene tetrahydromethanopterin reductase-like flavin-dependent oxidoreductase (luciferase family)
MTEQQTIPTSSPIGSEPAALRLGTITLWADDLDMFRRNVRLYEDLGYDLIAVGDAPFAFHDMYLTLGLVAADTTRVRFATAVATPFLRHPVSDALAIATLDDVSGGRATFVLGSGGGVPQGLGVRPATAERTGEYLSAMRTLLRGEPVEWDGSQTGSMNQVHPLPLYMSAYGPKSWSVAGRVADGVLMGVGSSERQLSTLREGVQTVRQAAAEAGRDPDAIDFWVNSHLSVADTREEAIEPVLDFLGSTGAFKLRPKHSMERVPQELHEPLYELRRRYNIKHHALAGGTNGPLVKELGLAEYLAAESAVCGTPDEVLSVLAEFQAAGVTCVLNSVSGTKNPDRVLRRFAELAR